MRFFEKRACQGWNSLPMTSVWTMPHKTSLCCWPYNKGHCIATDRTKWRSAPDDLMQLQKVDGGPFSRGMSFNELERHFGLSTTFPDLRCVFSEAWKWTDENVVFELVYILSSCPGGWLQAWLGILAQIFAPKFVPKFQAKLGLEFWRKSLRRLSRITEASVILDSLRQD